METLASMKNEKTRDDDDDDGNDDDDDDDDVRIQNTILCAPLLLLKDCEAVCCEGVD